MNIEITIAIPVYNASKHIHKSLYSAINQDFKDFEILIIDNKSTDNTTQIVEDIIKKTPNHSIRIIKHPINKGLGASKNTAIDNAKGKYLFFMDSDDFIEPNTLTILYDKIKQYNAQIAIGSIIYEDENQVPIQKTVCPDLHYEEKYCYLRDINSFYWMTWNKLYNLEFLKETKIRCIPHHLHEDLWFTFQIAAYTTNIVYSSLITYHYILNSNSICNQHKKIIQDNNLIEHIEILEHEYKVLTTIPIFNYPQLHNLYTSLFINTSYTIYSSSSKNKHNFISRLNPLKPLLYFGNDLRYKIFLLILKLISYRAALIIDFYIITKIRHKIR